MVECKINLQTINQFLTFGVAILIAVNSVLTIISLSIFNLSNYIMSFYYLLFAIVLLLAECKVKFVLKRFHLLEYQFGKFVYCVLLGLIMLNSSGLQLACAIVLVTFGVYHLVLQFIVKPKEGGQQAKQPEDLSARDRPLQTP